jgi:hypothetical protein
MSHSRPIAAEQFIPADALKRASEHNVRLLMTRLIHTEDRHLATTISRVGQSRGNRLRWSRAGCYAPSFSPLMG